MEEENKPVEGETVIVAAPEAEEPKADNGYKDITLTCAECGKEFVWTAGEQAFYAEHGFRQPKRCKECRPIHNARIDEARKERAANGGYSDATKSVAVTDDSKTILN